ncbi:hypothetical protein AVEN_58144-1, partial [Araneus ventricosus]
PTEDMGNPCSVGDGVPNSKGSSDSNHRAAPDVIITITERSVFSNCACSKEF